MKPIADHTYSHLMGFLTESQFFFPRLDLAYKTWGTLNETRDNVIVICHALTGHADAKEWFAGLFAKGGLLDSQEHFVICINVPGSCYGSTGPQSINPETGDVYGPDFPKLSIRDMVRAQQLVLDGLGIRGIELVIGGSMGGMQTLEFSIMDRRVKAAAVIAAGARHESWAIGISEAQRQAIYADAHWNGGRYTPEKRPVNGLSAARMMAMITYRAHGQYNARFGRERRPDDNEQFQVESYLRYQGEKMAARFDPLSYVRLTQAMDTHDVGRNRGGLEKALGSIRIPVLVVGIDSDNLYPPREQEHVGRLLAEGVYRSLHSEYGHDAFLIEFEQLNDILSEFTRTYLPKSNFNAQVG
ncbi:MAG: homoserine O-acetyltransferase MetX [Cyclonatronaceae bacterium]